MYVCMYVHASNIIGKYNPQNYSNKSNINNNINNNNKITPYFIIL